MTQQETSIEHIKNYEITSFFDCLADILLKISDNTLYKAQDFDKYFSKYMLCRYLSMSSKFIYIAEYLNTVQYNLTNEQLYHLAYTLVPKQKSSFIKYLKSKKLEKDKNNNILKKDETNISIFDI